MIRRNEKTGGSKHIISLLSSRVCYGNFPKHFECFGMSLAVKIWQTTRPSKMHLLIRDKTRRNYRIMLITSFSKIPNNISSRKSYAGITKSNGMISETSKCFGKILAISFVKKAVVNDGRPIFLPSLGNTVFVARGSE